MTGRNKLDPVLLAAAAVHAALVAFRLDAQSLWLDEVTTREVVLRPVSQWGTYFAALPEQHPLHYVLLKGWLFASDSAVALRSLSAVLSVATLVVLYYLARALFDQGAARIVAFLAAASPFLVYYGQEARTYTLLAFLVVVSTLLLVRWLDEPKRSTEVAYLVAGILGAYTHFFFIFTLAAHAVVVLFRARSLGTRWRRITLAWTVMALAYLPWAVLILSNRQEQGWRGLQHVVFGLPYSLMRFALGYGVLLANARWKRRVWLMVAENAGLLTFAALAHGALLLAGLAYLRRRRGGADVVVAGFAVPITLAFLASPFLILIGERYFMVSFPFYLLLLALGFRHLFAAGGRWRALGVAVALLYVAVTARALYGFYFDPEFGKEPWRDVAAYVAREAAPGELKVVHQGFAMMAFNHYYPEDLHESVMSGDLVSDETLSSQDHVWLILSHGGDWRAWLERRLGPTHEVETQRFFPKESGITVVKMVRREHTS